MKHALLVVDLKALAPKDRLDCKPLLQSLGEVEQPSRRLGEASWLIHVEKQFDEIQRLLAIFEHVPVAYTVEFYDDPIASFEKK